MMMMMIPVAYTVGSSKVIVWIFKLTVPLSSLLLVLVLVLVLLLLAVVLSIYL